MFQPELKTLRVDVAYVKILYNLTLPRRAFCSLSGIYEIPESR